MRNPLLCILLSLVLSISCKKENERPQWDVAIVGPVLHATLGIEELIGDSTLQTLSDGALVLNFDTTIAALDSDSLLQVEDTTIQTIELFFPFPTNLPRGFQFPVDSNEFSLDIDDVQLKKAIIQEGRIKIEIRNTLHSKVNFTYTIPGAFKNGQVFQIFASVDSGSATDPKFFTGEYDFSGYEVDLRGINNSYNTIRYDLEAQADPNAPAINFPVGASDTLINLQATLMDIEPLYVRGYLGQTETTETVSKDLKIGGIIRSGILDLDSISLGIDITNYIGAEEQAYIPYFRSYNDQTGNVVDLSAPSFIQNYHNINRAYINSSLPDTLVPSTYSILLNNSNSNLINLLENLPDRLSYDVILKLNPLGNISGSNDFAFRDRLVDTRLKLKMPLRFSASQLILSDTVSFNIANATDYDPVGFTTLKMIAENGFPMDLNIQLFLIDENKIIIDSLLTPDLINSAPYDMNYRSIGIRETIINIPVDENRKQKLLGINQIGIRVTFNTPDFPQMIQLYSNYRLDLKLVTDGIYSIR